MPSTASSTGATCGSGCRLTANAAKSSPTSTTKTAPNMPAKYNDHSSSSERSAAVSQNDEYYNDRIASYLTDIGKTPRFEGMAAKDNIQAHISQMELYLDEFDKS
ncbi:hypothetical protein ONS96_003701 [Cadophora gregata f. sp. sojae]|nr:hypothetical protein ONS96_003701 [Cadophora gregata f. sp. sojae]